MKNTLGMTPGDTFCRGLLNIALVHRLPPGLARSVALAGSFNQWSATSHPLAREGSRGIWPIAVILPPGEHLFMFVVDGTQWISPTRPSL